MAELQFIGLKDGVEYDVIPGSGVGFFGATFGSSVQVGSYQDSTWITDGAGSAEGPQINNTKYDGVLTSGVVWNGIATTLRNIPNMSGTMNIRFSDTNWVKTQNASVRAFNRVDPNVDQVGVTLQAAQLVHPWDEFEILGSGDLEWSSIHGSGVTLSLLPSPGESGLNPNGPDTSGLRHDWYLALSASPTSVGAKTSFGLFCSLEYL